MSIIDMFMPCPYASMYYYSICKTKLVMRCTTSSLKTPKSSKVRSSQEVCTTCNVKGRWSRSLSCKQEWSSWAPIWWRCIGARHNLMCGHFNWIDVKAYSRLLGRHSSNSSKQAAHEQQSRWSGCYWQGSEQGAQRLPICDQLSCRHQINTARDQAQQCVLHTVKFRQATQFHFMQCWNLPAAWWQHNFTAGADSQK